MSAPAYPIDIAAVTCAWLNRALATRFPGIEIASAVIIKRIDGTGTKLRYELAYDRKADATRFPSSLWVKGSFDPKGAHQGEAFANEVNFFRDIAPLLPINRPDCYYGALDSATGNGVVLLEDLINRNASFGQASKPLTPDQAAAVLSLQARYHAYFWKSSRLKDFTWLKIGGAIAGANMVDQYFGLWEGAMPLRRFTHVPETQRDKRRMRDALAGLMAHLRGQDICLVHGDSHVANLFFDPDGRPGYLDWQHVMRGNWAFDFANFLITALSVSDRRTHERALLTHYLRELSAHGAAAPGLDEAWRLYRRYAMWPFMWVMCPDTVHPEEICTLNTERACTAIEDLETIAILEAA